MEITLALSSLSEEQRFHHRKEPEKKLKETDDYILPPVEELEATIQRR
jgi:hypothetical protein